MFDTNIDGHLATMQHKKKKAKLIKIENFETIKMKIQILLLSLGGAG